LKQSEIQHRHLKRNLIKEVNHDKLIETVRIALKPQTDFNAAVQIENWKYDNQNKIQELIAHEKSIYETQLALELEKAKLTYATKALFAKIEIEDIKKIFDMDDDDIDAL
jgi:hypothetical protein